MTGVGSISIVGGGPAGLYLAILTKKRRPGIAISVLERNRPGDAYGFGVVFSDETLDHFSTADELSYRRLAESFIHWGDIEIRPFADPAPIVSGGHGFAAVSRRRLLEILADRARELEVDLRFETETESLAQVPAADLIVAADGANSRIRSELAGHLRPTTTWRENKYVWLGTSKVFEKFLKD